jgi:hypothetical protein
MPHDMFTTHLSFGFLAASSAIKTKVWSIFSIGKLEIGVFAKTILAFLATPVVKPPAMLATNVP